MNWNNLPSLASLRAFETAARHGNYSRAAKELNVTHAAIAQHVRGLEKELGTVLMTRSGRGMALTHEGQRLATQLSDGFGLIAGGLRQLQQANDLQPLAVTTTPSFAENWLMPRLGEFWSAHPGLKFSITPTMDIVDLNREPFDMAIRYGKGDWPGLTSTFMLPADYVVVGTPNLFEGRTVENLTDLGALPWLFDMTYREEQYWAMNNGLDADAITIREMPNYTLLLSALRAGAGVSVVKSVLVQDDVKEGRLQVVQEHKHDATGYYILERPTGLSKDGKILKRWLLAAEVRLLQQATRSSHLSRRLVWRDSQLHRSSPRQRPSQLPRTRLEQRCGFLAGVREVFRQHPNHCRPQAANPPLHKQADARLRSFCLLRPFPPFRQKSPAFPSLSPIVSETPHHHLQGGGYYQGRDPTSFVTSLVYSTSAKLALRSLPSTYVTGNRLCHFFRCRLSTEEVDKAIFWCD